MELSNSSQVVYISEFFDTLCPDLFLFLMKRKLDRIRNLVGFVSIL